MKHIFTISSSAIGGITPYTYLWSNGATGQNIDSLGLGVYSLTVVDSIYCSVEAEYEFPYLWLNLDTNIIGQGCDGIYNNPSVYLQNGEIHVSATGGTSPYDYTGNNGFPVTTFYCQTDSSVYTLTVTDANGCVGIADIVVGSDQSIFLPQGWSHFSSYINPFGDDYVHLPFEALGIEMEVNIMKNYSGGVYWPQWGLNSIGDYMPSEGYQIKMLSDQTLYMKGHLECPEDIVINLDTISGEWYHLGFPRTSPSPPEIQFASLGNDLIIVKNDSNGIYWQQYGLNTMGDLQPGEGYLAKVVNNYSFSYQANDNFMGTKSLFAPKSQNYSTSNDNINTDVCMLLIIPHDSWDTEPSIGDEIQVIGESGQLAGYTNYQGNHTGVVVYGDDVYTPYPEALAEGESFSVVVVNQATKAYRDFKISKWIKGNEFYRNGKISIASSVTQNPELQNNENVFDFTIQPNPNHGDFSLLIKAKETNTIKLEVYDINGSRLFVDYIENPHNTSFVHKMELEFLANGIYSIKLTCKEVCIGRKIVIIK